jgi:hypothetical protein
MKHPKHIMGAIMLLQQQKMKKTLPWWLVPLDYAVTVVYLTAYFGCIAFLIYKLVTWLK